MQSSWFVSTDLNLQLGNRKLANTFRLAWGQITIQITFPLSHVRYVCWVSSSEASRDKFSLVFQKDVSYFFLENYELLQHFHVKKHPFCPEFRETRSRFFWHEKRDYEKCKIAEIPRNLDVEISRASTKSRRCQMQARILTLFSNEILLMIFNIRFLAYPFEGSDFVIQFFFLFVQFFLSLTKFKLQVTFCIG